MSIPLQIHLNGLGESPAIEASIQRHAERLARYQGRIKHCNVTVEQPHRHQHKGNDFQVRVNVSVVGKGNVVAEEHAADQLHEGHEGVYVALRDAFSAVQRQLEDHLHRGHSERESLRHARG